MTKLLRVQMCFFLSHKIRIETSTGYGFERQRCVSLFIQQVILQSDRSVASSPPYLMSQYRVV